MGRPTIHDTQDLLDTAARLAAEEGPARVTMAAVAQAAGAPSGSLYHRFDSRGGLLGELWLRTVVGFQAPFLEALASEPVVEACVAAACHVVTWSRENRMEACLLLRGPADFAPAEWSSSTREGVDEAQRELDAALRYAVARLPDAGDDALERVVLVTVDLPYTVVRRHLASATGIVPPGTETLVEDFARAVLSLR